MTAQRLCLGAAAAGLTAAPAAAHSPLPGIEGLYTGLLHPVATPDQALMLLALGLVVGGHVFAQMGPAFAALGAGLLTGLLLGTPDTDPATWLYALAAIAAAVAALAPGRARPVAIGLALGAGVLLGWASLPDGGTAQDRAFTISGSALGVGLGLLYVGGAIDLLRDRVRKDWLDIALRVIAAWLFAISLLMLALRFAPAAA